MATKKKKPEERPHLLGRPFVVRNLNEEYWDRIMALAFSRGVPRAYILNEAMAKTLKEYGFLGELTNEQQAFLDHARSKKHS